MSIATEIQRLQEAKADIKAAIEEKGVEVGNELIDGYADKVDAVYDKGVSDGKKSQYDEFWDTFQCNGQRNWYDYAFANITGNNGRVYMNWNENNLKPKYPIKPVNTENQNYVFGGIEIEDFKKHCEDNNIVIDLSECENLNNFFRLLYTKYIPDVDIPKVKKVRSTFYDCRYLIEAPRFMNGDKIEDYNSCYYNCNRMVKIPILWATSVTSFNSAFEGCDSLEEISEINGMIKVDISLWVSKNLSKESITSIITHLSDTQGATLTLSKRAVNKEFPGEGEWEIFLAENKPSVWSINLV